MPSFLDLPPELRNRVYSIVFANPQDRVTLANDSHEDLLAVARFRVLTSRRRHHLALLATNRQIRAEAYGYAYGGVVHARPLVPGSLRGPTSHPRNG
ncbi:hypothetical protein LTR01_006118 [Friedmanniomyces endolithicus]|nr:hypothetical protein LTS09_009261 [Friedmanniomyces endolithicus]KAK0306822.1 hypothetical protein LTR01_006118 [Friedmanniomyces endolithicus]KAK0834007.1 hypothetical protein LTR73_001770 [Friedmanniomyces endolithicus]